EFMRLFVAINFPAEVRARLIEIRETIRRNSVSGNFTADPNLHLTLAFLGECGKIEFELAARAVESLVFEPFTLSLGECGRFRRGGGDVWWCGLKKSTALDALQAEVSRRLTAAGFSLESRDYSPHITLCREAKLKAGFVPPKAAETAFAVRSVELMKSERLGGKLTYTAVASSLKTRAD
ncbi:MAG TPA: RNA 2',3'-cyclic phosphodiesterase, partial [Eubacteriales bacterium]|nr:RNA 2',3'-cyclic phosphodiesterase [Eubacteriales bacterium]